MNTVPFGVKRPKNDDFANIVEQERERIQMGEEPRHAPHVKESKGDMDHRRCDSGRGLGHSSGAVFQQIAIPNGKTTKDRSYRQNALK